MKLIDVTSDSYTEYNKDSDEKFKVGDHTRISKYKNIFAKAYTQNWSEESFAVSKISDLNGELITGSFYGEELRKTSQEKI